MKFRRGTFFVVSLALISCQGGGCARSGAEVEEVEEIPVFAQPKLPGLGDGSPSLMSELKAALSAKGKDYKPRTHHLESNGVPSFINRLIFETSPYLLQHAHNPVNWFSWGKEAFDRAKKENKPVLLSVGYSTCHWCHVMERESFEDKEIAAFINRHFIAIKVDREERPDIDDIYMRAVRFLSGRGGWPMTVLMTPDKEPFFGGTYIPARDGDRGSRQGFFTLLKETSSQYQSDPTELIEKGQSISQKVEAAAAPARPGNVPGAEILTRLVSEYTRRLDRTHGGFGRAPKFPRPSSLGFLLRMFATTAEKDSKSANEALFAATLTLSKMAAGGMNDQVGGGFHRYSVDARWLVPHFEKMLYDNAQLASAYLDAFQVTGKKLYAETARATLDYVLREMVSPEGAFYSATDADSLVPGGHMEEGYFFTWTLAELKAALTQAEYVAVTKTYGVTARGNFEGRNIFHLARPVSEVAKEWSSPAGDLELLLSSARGKLYEHRKKRVAPGLDDKILTSWNGLMISALARGGAALTEKRYAQAAKKAATYLLKAARKESGELLRSTREGRSKQLGFADDYAFFISGLLDVAEVTKERLFLDEARALQETFDREFWDGRDGGYFKTGDSYEELLARDKPSYDGAEPSANSVAAENLLRLANWTSDDAYRKKAERLFSAFSSELAQGMGVPRMMSALSRYLEVPLQIVVVSQDENDEVFGQMRNLVRGSYLPNALVVIGNESVVATLSKSAPVLRGKSALNGKTTAYVCERGRCELPAKDVETLRRQLEKYISRSETKNAKSSRRSAPGPQPKRTSKVVD